MAAPVTGAHTVALKGDGTVWAWGGNEYGQIGDGSVTDRLLPFQVAGVAGVVDVSAGHGQSFALKSDGHVLSWGSNIAGQLGDGAPITRTVPLPVQVLNSVTAISAGDSHSLARRSDGSVWSWGASFSGELGDGTFIAHSVPAPIPTLSSIAEIAAGGAHSLARTQAGSVYSWGYNDRGQLGNGSLAGTPSPILVAGVSAKALAAGNRHSAVVAIDGTVWTWGANDSGQLGDGTFTQINTPVQIAGLTGIVAVAARGWHTAALKSDGTVWTWGLNDAGQLGRGTTLNGNGPVQVSGLSGVIAIATGYNRTIALKGDGTVWVWGAGPIGNGGWNGSSVPVMVSGLTAVTAVGSSSYHLVAAKADGSVWGWGDNGFGQVGDGTYVTRDRPVVVVADGGAGTLDAGNWFLDLDPAAPSSIPAASVPTSIALAQRIGADDRLDLDATAKFKSADFGQRLNTYVMALVPPAFFDQVPSATGEAGRARARLKAGETLLLAQLTPNGWSVVVGGQLIPYAQAVASAAGGAANILNGVNANLLQGARFCIGYGSDAQSMLTREALREVLVLETAFASASGLPCVPAGVYVDGPATSIAGTSITFNASVVGVQPTGSVQFRDGASLLLGPVTLSASNAAVARAAIVTSSLAAGEHSIGVAYSGDSQNTARSTEFPLRHAVRAAAPGTASVELSGPASSELSSTAVFTARVTGANPTGSVQFRDGSNNLGAPQPLVSGLATLRTATLAVGDHSISAAYLGDSANAPASSTAGAHRVFDFLSTDVTLSLTESAVAFGAPVTITATVTGSNPTGNVVVRDEAAVLATANLANGSASVTLSNLTAGLHWVTATYSGDGANQPVTSLPVVVAVRAPTSPPANPPRLANIATRMQVLTGDNVLIGGFIIQGSGPQTVAVRARGPSLTALGVPGALANPVLQLYSGPRVIASNDNWQSAANAAEIQSSGFAPADALESAILITLDPGAYTAIVSGAGGSTGVGIIEVFAR